MNEIEVSVKKMFQPSPQQQTLFDWITKGTGSAILEATAGSGKTTTLIQALTLMEGLIFFGAYNKKIAEEIQNRAPVKDNLVISTMHAAGFKMWRKVARNVKVDSNKCRTIYREASSKYPEYQPFESQVLSLVSYAKQSALGATVQLTDFALRDLIEHFDIDCLGQEDLIIKLTKKTLCRSIEQDYVIVDFDDMIYSPLVHNVRGIEFDWVLIDEAQDTNAARRALALLMLKRGGRMIAVGDRHQAIYGFTGADSNALDLIASSVQAVRLPLTVTYRCPKAVVNYAHQYVSHIEAHESAPDGIVRSIAADEIITNLVKPGDAILCRFNAPLITTAYQFIAAGIPAKVAGREIGSGLKNLARRWKVKTFIALQNKLEAYVDHEVAKFRAKEQESKAIAVEDRVTCLNVLIQRLISVNPHPVNAVETLCDEIDKIFSDTVGNEAVLLSSGHKSKGLEWNNKAQGERK